MEIVKKKKSSLIATFTFLKGKFNGIGWNLENSNQSIDKNQIKSESEKNKITKQAS